MYLSITILLVLKESEVSGEFLQGEGKISYK